jgi:hypothetical protein
MFRDEYKYRIAVINEKVRVNVNPITLCDVNRFRQYLEGQTYIHDLARYRPQIRIQTFIDYRKKNKYMPPEIEAKRKAVVRDWFRLTLWFIRLRKAASGQTPESLILVEERI